MHERDHAVDDAPASEAHELPPGHDDVDPSVGPHSPAADDVSASATDVTSDGVLRWREQIEETARRAEETDG